MVSHTRARRLDILVYLEDVSPLTCQCHVLAYIDVLAESPPLVIMPGARDGYSLSLVTRTVAPSDAPIDVIKSYANRRERARACMCVRSCVFLLFDLSRVPRVASYIHIRYYLCVYMFQKVYFCWCKFNSITMYVIYQYTDVLYYVL